MKEKNGNNLKRERLFFVWRQNSSSVKLQPWRHIRRSKALLLSLSAIYIFQNYSNDVGGIVQKEKKNFIFFLLLMHHLILTGEIKLKKESDLEQKP